MATILMVNLPMRGYRSLHFHGDCKARQLIDGKAPDTAVLGDFFSVVHLEPILQISFRRSGLHKNSNLSKNKFHAATVSPRSGFLGFQESGYIMSVMDKTGDSLDYLEEAFLLSPLSQEISIEFHRAAIATSNFKHAESVCRIALRDYPFHRPLRFMLIDLLLRQSSFDQAMSETESAMIDFGVTDGILSAALSIRQHLGPLNILQTSDPLGTVSLCMIVRDEQTCLARCLYSAKPVVNEIIVVDTGSTDRTRDIAVAFGARVFEIRWEKDFARARNVSLANALGDWILVLDADEMISPLDYDRFRKLIKNGRTFPLAYTIQTRNYTYHSNTIGWKANTGQYPEEKGHGWFPSDKVRLFSNDPGICFSHPVHEMVEPSLNELKVPIRQCSIPVHHFGKMNEEKTLEKTRAYSDLGREKLKKSRSSLSAIRELAIQCAHLEKYEEAIHLWGEYLQKEPRSGEAFLNIGAACWNLNRFEDAAGYAQKALKINPMVKEARFNLAVALFMMGQAREVKSILRSILKQQPDYPAAQFMLCVAHACLGELQAAAGICTILKALPMGKYLHVSFLDIAKKFLSGSRSEYARSTLEAAVSLGCADSQIVSLLESCRSAA